MKISKELGDFRLELLEIRSENGQQRLLGNQNYGIQALQEIQQVILQKTRAGNQVGQAYT